MKIAVLTQYFPSSAQPWAGHSAYQTLRLLAQRHPMRVFYPESRYPHFLTPKSRTHAALDGTYRPTGVNTQYIPYPALPLISRAVNGWVISRKLRAAIEQYAPDILLSYVIYPDGYAAVEIGRQLRLPVVLTAIGSDLNRISGRVVRKHTRDTLAHAAWTTTVSDDLRKTAQRLGAPAARSTTILNGCDTDVFHPRSRREAREALQLDADSRIIVYVGRLDLRKGLAELVAAVSQLKSSQAQTHCYLVGEGSDRPAVVDLIAKHGVKDRVHLIPPCDTSGVAQWMAAADLVTLPSYKEGCPNVVIEALASGRPVVATDVGGIPELMDTQSGRLIPPRNVPALASALEEVLSERWDAETLASRHARSWGQVADELEHVLKQALIGQNKMA